MGKKADIRSDKIMRILLQKSSATVNELIDVLEVDATNVRKDLTRLEQRGLIKRTHGGAELSAPLLYEPFRYDTSFQIRERSYAEEKRRIGCAAADMIAENETIGLTAGTTVTQVARSIRHRNNIRVVTNAVNIGMELCNQPGIKTSMTGGTIPWAWTFALCGPAALRFMEDVYLDKAFIGIVGIDAKHGVTSLESEEVFVLRSMIQHAKRVIVVADSSKIGKCGTSFVCPCTDIHVLITDKLIADNDAAEFARLGVEVIRC